MDSDIPLIVIGVGLILMGFLVTPWTLQLLFGIAGGLCIALGCEDHYEL
jgi:hypothetical protein